MTTIIACRHEENRLTDSEGGRPRKLAPPRLRLRGALTSSFPIGGIFREQPLLLHSVLCACLVEFAHALDSLPLSSSDRSESLAETHALLAFADGNARELVSETEFELYACEAAWFAVGKTLGGDAPAMRPLVDHVIRVTLNKDSGGGSEFDRNIRLSLAHAVFNPAAGWQSSQAALALACAAGEPGERALTRMAVHVFSALEHDLLDAYNLLATLARRLSL